MLERHRELLRINNHYLLIHLEISKQFIKILLEREVLILRHSELINQNIPNRKKVELFLSILPKRSSNSFDNFLYALDETNQSYIKDKLMISYDNSIPFCIEEQDMVDNLYDNRSTNNNKSIILIINNEFKISGRKRIGSVEDVKALKEFFVDELGYYFYSDTSQDNKTAEEMKDIIKEFSSYISHQNFKMCVFVIMSHGLQGTISGQDEENLDVQWILKNLSEGTDDIFKIIIFACCRGEQASLKSEEQSQKKYDMNSIQELMSKDSNLARHYGKFAPKNSVIFYSTQINYQSHRKETGTIFIQSMISVFSTFYKKETVRKMMSRVKSKMSELNKEYDQVPDIKENYFADIYLSSFNN